MTRRRAPYASLYARPVLGSWRERTYPAESTTDWIGTRRTTFPIQNALNPIHGEEVFATTPLLMWPDLGATHSFTVQIMDLAGTVLRTLSTPVGDNFLLVPAAQALPAGVEYKWSVRSDTNPSGFPYTTPRHFYVRPEATPYSIDVAAAGTTLSDRLYNKTVSTAHPRFFTKDSALVASIAGALSMNDKRNLAVQYLEANIGAFAAHAAGINENSIQSNSTIPAVYSRMSALLYYWKLVGSTTNGIRARDAAKAYFLSLTTYWNGSTGTKRGYGTEGGTSQTGSKTDYLTQSQDARLVNVVMALGIDAFYPGSGSGTDLTTTEYNRALEYIDYRFSQLKDDLYDTRQPQIFQYDSLGINAVGYTAFASMLIAESNTSTFPNTYGLQENVGLLLKRFMPVWLTLQGAFRNEDGSTHRSSAYDDIDSFTSLVLFALHAYGIDLMAKPKFYNAPTYRLYMNGIPGSRYCSQFGDSATEDVPRVASYAALYFRNPSSLNSAAYGQMSGLQMFEEGVAFAPAYAPIPVPQAQALTSKVFPTGGYYCSLANFTDPKATAVYLRSSPFGGYNHAHHDMNGIIVWGGGRQLLIDTGYYEHVGFGPPHFEFWARASRGHSTLTLDYGAGQQASGAGNAQEDRFARGKIVAWEETGEANYVIADATESYIVPGYTLSSYLRAVVHMRDDLILVFDYALSSSGSHNFDWNFHTAKALAYAGGVYTITDGTAQAYLKNEYCNMTLAAPAAWASGARTGAAYNYSGWDGPLGFTDTVSSGTTTSLTKTGAAWTANQYQDAYVTVNGLDRLITGNTANTLTWATALPGAAAGTFTVGDLWAPGPPAFFVGREQYHHRICTTGGGTVYKAVTSISVNTANQISNTSTAAVGNTIAFSFTFKGRARTVTFDFVAKTVTIA